MRNIACSCSYMEINNAVDLNALGREGQEIQNTPVFNRTAPLVKFTGI